MAKTATIVDHDGDVHTGKVVDVNDHFIQDTILGALCPPTLLMPASSPTVTVEYNGERHSGHKVK